MIFTIDRLLDNDAYQYHINQHHSNIQINLESEFFMPHHFELQVGQEAGMTPLYFNLDGTESRLEVANNPFKLKPEPTVDGVTKCITGKAFIGNDAFDIKYCQAKGKGLFGGYMYYEIKNGSDTYKIYDVNQGSKGRNFCIYLNERLIAIAKFTHLGYSGAIYTIYSENNVNPHILTVLIMFSDAVILRNDDGQSALFVALPKEIKNKYDSTFVEKIITQDGQ